MNILDFLIKKYTLTFFPAVVATQTSVYFDIMCHDLYRYYLLQNVGGSISGNPPTYYDDVLEYDEQKQEWNPIGSMSLKRMGHAVAVVNYNSIKDYCN